MWIYEQSTGKLFHNETLVGTGYSGHGEGRNNPSMQNVHDVGPIPCGMFTIGKPFEHPTHGPRVMRLLPKPGTEMFGRSGFLMHGDSIKNPGTASLGCICQSRFTRERVIDSLDTESDLKVVDFLSQQPVGIST